MKCRALRGGFCRAILSKHYPANGPGLADPAFLAVVILTMVDISYLLQVHQYHLPLTWHSGELVAFNAAVVGAALIAWWRGRPPESPDDDPPKL
jgi:hypothetical protein